MVHGFCPCPKEREAQITRVIHNKFYGYGNKD